MLCRASKEFGVKVEEPQWVECPFGDKQEDFIKPI